MLSLVGAQLLPVNRNQMVVIVAVELPVSTTSPVTKGVDSNCVQQRYKVGWGFFWFGSFGARIVLLPKILPNLVG